MEDGQNKKVTEAYTVEALSFSEAESAITEEMSHYISGEFWRESDYPAAYGEIFFSDCRQRRQMVQGSLWAFITIDEKTEKEKRSTITYLVQAHSVNGAVKHVDEVMGKTMIDYDIVSIADTKIMDVFEHKAASKASDAKPEYE